MKRRYQIEQQRAPQQFRRLATEQNPNIQMVLPLAEIVGLMQQGVGNLLRQAGLALMHLVMGEEVKSLAGERHQQHAGRRSHRWGKEDGYCVADGQKGRSFACVLPPSFLASFGVAKTKGVRQNSLVTSSRMPNHRGKKTLRPHSATS